MKKSIGKDQSTDHLFGKHALILPYGSCHIFNNLFAALQVCLLKIFKYMK